MKLVIDFQGAQACNSQRGIGRYCKAIVLEICRRYSQELDIHILINGAFLSEGMFIRKTFNPMIPVSNFHTFFPCSHANVGCMNLAERKRTEFIRELVLDRINPDIVLITSLFEGMVDNAFIGGKTPATKYKTAVVLYDLIPLLYPNLYLKSKQSKIWYQECIEKLKEMDCILSISNYTKKTAKEFLNIPENKVFNISGAIDHSFFLPDQHHVEKKQNYIFCVSGMDPRKNLAFLIEAFANAIQSVKLKYQLIVTCHVTKESRNSLGLLMKSLKLSDEQVIVTGYVSDKELLRLYRGCSLFVFPSWQEGFGLPVLEAMACGAPVLAANTASIPEIGGDSLIYFDPFDKRDLTNKMVYALNEPQVLLNNTSNGLGCAQNFQWSKVAETTIKSLREVLVDTNKKKIGNHKNKSVAKPNLAYFSPMPPDKSGIADYSEKLSEELTKYYDVTIIGNLKDPKQDWVKKIKHQSAEKFLANAGGFDRVLYHFGNSYFHEEMFDFLKTNPGVSVLHDFFLGGVIGLRSDKYSLIYKNYGYGAVKKICGTTNSDFLNDYPVNLSVLQDSFGVIVHSSYALNLIKKWYGDLALEKSSVVPLFRSKANKLSRKESREKLKLDKNKFVIAAFGHLGPNKLNERLLDSWLSSSLANSSQLVFVGQAGSSKFDNTLLANIKKHRDNVQVLSTGWVSKEDYLAWLSAVDVAVQLRNNTRGETSAAALDCLSYGVPTIVNSHGDLADLPKNAVIMLKDGFSNSELIQAIEKVYADLDYRSKLSIKGSAYVVKNHDIQSCGLAYFDAIESFYHSRSSNIEATFKSLKKNNLLPKVHSDKLTLIKALATSIDNVPRVSRYFIDVSELVNRDARTGIQRVVRNILRCLLVDPPSGFLVEPVYATNETLGYFKATKFIEGFFALPNLCGDELIDPAKGDIFLGLDLQPQVVISQTKYLDMMYLKGVSVQFVVYDLIPTKFPEFFPEGAKSVFDDWLNTVTNYDQLVCISKTTKQDVENWLQDKFPSRLETVGTCKLSLSSELLPVDRTVGNPRNAWFLRHTLLHHNVFLMVGTLEPRKEHAQVLNAFELMWAQGKDKKLLIVGKKGWCVENLSQKIKNHAQFNKNIFWLENCSDEFLMELYKSCHGLIAASWAEGYGLPLMESYKSGLPVFCRDIPVFREIADKFATFFSANNSESFLAQFLEWELSLKSPVRLKSESVESICWEKATKELVKITVKND